MRHILFNFPIPWLDLPWFAVVLILAAGLIVGGWASYRLGRNRPSRIHQALAMLLAPLGVVVAYAVAVLVFGARPTSLHVPIMGYGLMIVLGFLCGIGLGWWRAKRCGENPDHVMNLGLLALVGGIGGARLLYVLGNLREFTGQGFFASLVAIVNVRAGGLVYYGGLIAATALALIYILLKKLSTRRMLDIIAPSLMLGLAFGRGGCFLNGCCWGGKCTLFDDAQTHRQQLALAGQPVPEPSAFERLMTASLVEFPYGSPAYEQHAQELPWRIINADRQVFELPGYSIPVYIVQDASSRGSREKIRKVYYPSARANVPDEPPPGPSVDVPANFLRPDIPKTVDYYTWKVIDRHGQVVGYLTSDARDRHIDVIRGADGQIRDYRMKRGPLPYAFSQPNEPVVVVRDHEIVNTDMGLQIDYSRLSRDELDEMSVSDRHAAQAARSLPVYPVQLYGIFNALLLCIVLSVFFPRRWREGQVFALMLILYPISRFLLEGVRKDTDPVALGMTLSQTISLYMFVGGVLMWVALYYLPAVARIPLSGKRIEPETEASS